jgi:hypothetical protein
MKIFSQMNFKTPQAAFNSGLRMLFAPVVLVVLIVIFINVAAT